MIGKWWWRALWRTLGAAATNSNRASTRRCVALVLQYVVVCCSVLQCFMEDVWGGCYKFTAGLNSEVCCTCVAVCCSVLQCFMEDVWGDCYKFTAGYIYIYIYIYTSSTWRCVASVLQYVASVLQCVEWCQCDILRRIKTKPQLHYFFCRASGADNLFRFFTALNFRRQFISETIKGPMWKSIYIHLMSTMHCNTLQHTVTCCNTLQHAVSHCSSATQPRTGTTSSPTKVLVLSLFPLSYFLF